MPSSLADTVLSTLDARTITAIAGQLGVDPQTARQGINVALPVLVSALVRNSATPTGAESLANALARDHDGSALQNVPAAVNQYQAGPGEAILGHLFGRQQPAVEHAVSQSTGLNASALLQMLAPLVLAALGSRLRQQQLDPGGLANDLQRERARTANPAESGLIGMLTQVLDTNRDGSVVEELGGLLGQFLGSSATAAQPPNRTSRP